MTSFGSQLRSVREDMGWTIEYVSFKSKIQPNIIESLEDNDFSQFSSSSYVKSFLRKYSEFLDLDLDDEITEMEIQGFSNRDAYSVRDGVKENLEMTHFSKKNQRYRKAEKGKGSPIFLVGSVVVLLSTLAGFYYMGSQANSPEFGSRNILRNFESTQGAFSREREAKERLVSEKRPIMPLKASVSQNRPLASTRATISQGNFTQDQLNPVGEFDGIEKPDVSTLKMPNLDSIPSGNRATPQVRPREVNPLFDY